MIAILSPRPEEPPVGDGPHARGQRLHLAAARDDEAEEPGIARDAPGREGAADVDQRSRDSRPR